MGRTSAGWGTRLAALALVAAGPAPAAAAELRLGGGSGLLVVDERGSTSNLAIGASAELIVARGDWALVPALTLTWRAGTDPTYAVVGEHLLVERRLGRLTAGAGAGLAQLFVEDQDRRNLATGGLGALAQARLALRPALDLGVSLGRTWFRDATLTAAMLELRWTP